MTNAYPNLTPEQIHEILTAANDFYAPPDKDHPTGQPARSERSIQSTIWLEASKRGYKLFRNNVGQAWQGQTTHLRNATVIFGNGVKRQIHRAVLIEYPRPVPFGLAKGSGDLVGFKPVTITAGHVGSTIAQFVSAEIKTARGRVSAAQHHWAAFIKQHGGIGIIAKKPEDLP